MAKDKKVVASGVVAPVAGLAAYSLENFLEYITLRNELLASGTLATDLSEDFYNFFDWKVNGSSWTSEEIVGFDTESPLVGHLKDKIDYNAALAPNAAVGVASGLVGAIAAAKGNKPAAIMGAGINAATLVNLLYKGTEMMQNAESNNPLVLFNGAKIYVAEASALPLYIAAMGVEATLLIVTLALLGKDLKRGANYANKFVNNFENASLADRLKK